jgi:hypothetical protein
MKTDIKNSDVQEIFALYSRKETIERILRFKNEFPDLINLAISIKKIPDNKKLKNLFAEKLRESLSLYQKRKRNKEWIEAFIIRYQERVNQELKNPKGDSLLTYLNNSGVGMASGLFRFGSVNEKEIDNTQKNIRISSGNNYLGEYSIHITKWNKKHGEGDFVVDKKPVKIILNLINNDAGTFIAFTGDSL